jgi:nickel-dependent lactate racemase
LQDYYLTGHQGRSMRFSLPETWRVIKDVGRRTPEAAAPTPVPIPRLVHEALASPIGTPPLEQLVKGKQHVVIVTDDLTRPTPRRIILECLIDFLNEHGIDDDLIDVLIGLGTHRPVTEDEISECFGDDLCGRVRITNHDCHAHDLVPVGTLPFAGEVLINPLFLSADLRIAVGSIVPHSLNGFGGGAKLVFPGVAGFDSIKRHHSALVTAEGVSYGNLSGNPFHEEISEVGRMTSLHFIVNAVYDVHENVRAIVAGHFEEAFRVGAGLCADELTVSFDRPADVTIVSTFPYDDGPQITKPLGAAAHVTREDGVVILYADRILGGRVPTIMLESFGRALSLAQGDLRGLVFDYARRGELIAPEAPMDFNMAIDATLLHLSRVKVILVSEDADAEQAARLGFGFAGSLEEAVARVAEEMRSATVNVIPAGGLVLPLVADGMRFEY